MPDITNVNLRFLRKVRGVAPLSRYAVAHDGSLIVSAPDEMEVRTFHLVRFDPTGKSQMIETYSVETLRKTEIAQSGGAYIGITDDDLYLFREARKTRFLADRRASYADMALAESGQRFAVAFSDMLASGYSLALGDIGGRALWTKDFAFSIARVAVDRELKYIAVAGETGDLVLLDTARTTVLRHRQEASLTAVATNGPSRTVFAGGGGVGAIDADGKLLWFTELTADPIEVAVDAAGQTTAALLRLDETSGRLVFLSETGLPTWDIDYDEARPTGLSLSADGHFAAVSLRDGTLAVYEIHYGERLAALSAEQARAEANTLRESGNWHAAVEVLRSRLTAVPSDAEACVALADMLGAFREQAVGAAQTAEAVGDFAEADARLGDLLSADSLDADTLARRRDLRRRWADSARTAGTAALAAGESATAEARFIEAITADPLDAPAREALGEARRAAAEVALAQGRARIAAGDFTGAIAALTEAQRRGASGPEVTNLLREARVGESFALGNALYQDRQYAAALFQFKKVLRLDPDNAEARQKIGYAQNFLSDPYLTTERFNRLET